MISNRSRDIKQAQKEMFIRREMTTSFREITLEAKDLLDIYITRVVLSAKRGSVVIYFHGCTEFEFGRKLGTLILYKPSLRTALAHAMKSRYTPELVFKFDDLYEKQYRLEQLLSESSLREKAASNANQSDTDDELND